MELKRVGITGTGMYAPEGIITNHDLEAIIDTSDEWITKRTGIKERRKISDDQACSDLAAEAAKLAMKDAGIKAEDIDLVIVGTVTGDYQIPATACLVQDKIGAINAGAFDVAASCNGFILALITGAKYIATGDAHNVLVIGAEALTRFMNYKDRTSCILFGDGAGAVIISDKFERGEILSSQLGADGSGWRFMNLPAGGSKNVASQNTVDEGGHYIVVHGREVYKFAVNRMVDLVTTARERHKDIDFGLVVPHQVNLRIIESAREKLKLKEDDIAVNIHKYGNTSSASAVIMLHEVKESGRLDSMKDKLIVLCAFGAGLNWGYVALKW